jgi:DNA-damage-inducible protein D
MMLDSINFIIDRLRAIAKVSPRGTSYWFARELMEVLDYREWRDFREVIERAKTSCEKAGNYSVDHFVPMLEMVAIGSGAKRERENFGLSKYACYLIAMNGDPSKPEIANAQAYFTEKTYLQEQQESLTESERRLLIRNRVKDANRKLSGAAKESGVRSKMFGVFHDAGYQGLYGGLRSEEVKKRKKIDPKDDLLDCMGRAELAANEFRITQTEQTLTKQEIKGEQRAINTHLAIGKKVRATMKELGNPLPEDLPSEPSIKKLAAAKARESKRLKSNNQSR